MKNSKRKTLASVALVLTIGLQAITAYAIGATFEQKKVVLEAALIEEQSSRIAIEEEFEKLAEEKDAVQEELLIVKQQQQELEEEAGRLRQESRILEAEVKTLVEPIWQYSISTDITKSCGMTAEQLDKALENTKLKGLGQAYLDAEKEYKVNAVVMVAIHAHESGWGSSKLAINKNNLGGIKSKDGGWASFTSKTDCINYSASLLGENYLTPGGLFYNGTDLTSVNIKYCETRDWAGKVVDTANTITERIAE